MTWMFPRSKRNYAQQNCYYLYCLLDNQYYSIVILVGYIVNNPSNLIFLH